MEFLLKLFGIKTVLYYSPNTKYKGAGPFSKAPSTTCELIFKLKLNYGMSQQIFLMCKFSKVCMEYFVACNYFWLLVEAIFLHMLLFTAVLTKRRLLKKYMLLGWGKI